MGIHDRGYYQDDENQGAFGLPNFAAWPWSYRIIALCVLLFFLDHLIPVDGRAVIGQSSGYLTKYGQYNIADTFQRFQLWRPLTYMFIDPQPVSLLFSMLMVYWFGPRIEAFFGRPRFLAFYILCGLGGAVLGTLLTPLLLHGEPSFIGNLACFMGLLVATGMLFPNQTVLFFFVLPMTMQNLAILSVILNLAWLVTGSNEAAIPLGGALTSFFLVRTPSLLNFAEKVPALPTPRKQTFANPLKNLAKAFETKPVSEDELDRLLDKVHEHGIESLSAREKATLKKASKQRRRRTF